MEYDEIMKEITNGLTGDSDTDIAFLKKVMEQYKDHELAKEVIRACGRMIYDILPDDKKDEISRLITKDFIADEQILEEVRFNLYKKEYGHALELIEPLVEKIEEMFAAGMYQNDSVSEYFSFKELFEEILYVTKNEPERELRKVDFQADEIYLLYGIVLVDNGRVKDARKALEKAVRWNPMNAQIAFEHAETYKILGDREEFFRLSKEIFKIAFKSKDLARCYRNLAYYFVEKQLWAESVACNRISLCYDEESNAAKSELFYIREMAGDAYKEPTMEEFKIIAEKHGFPTGADPDVLGIAYTYGKHCLDEGQNEAAGYFLSIVYDLTDDESIKELLDKIK